MKLKRNIRLFFAAYGNLFFYGMAIFLFVVFIIQYTNQYFIDIKEEAHQQSIQEHNETIIQKNEQEKEIITYFINDCIEGNIEQAYAKLSENCKSEKFPNIEEFKEKFLSNYFSIKVMKYKLVKEEENFKIELYQNPLQAGTENSKLEIKCKIENEVLNNALYII